jgi:hypothetical protein
MRFIAGALSRLVLASLLSASAVACTVPQVAPTASPSPILSPVATATPAEPPTGTPQTPSPSPTSDPNASHEIAALVEAMEVAVVAGDRDAYLALIDLTDPVFATEHSRFADDWVANPPSDYDLTIANVVVDGLAASGVLTATWATGPDDVRSAELAVRFTQSDGDWRYAGEEWVTQEVEHFRIRVAPGLEAEFPSITESLPDVYDYVTTHFGWVPTTDMEIKLYTGPAELVATIWLSLPNIRGWNEPGESLKLGFDPERPSLTSTIAHEFTHFLEFNRADTQRSRMPWWLSEGIASFFGYHYDDTGVAQVQLDRVRDWAANAELAGWDAMAVFEETPRELWPNAYAQGYVFMAFITETYGETERNRWLAAMAIEFEIEEATQVVLETSFAELDALFVEWLNKGD